MQDNIGSSRECRVEGFRRGLRQTWRDTETNNRRQMHGTHVARKTSQQHLRIDTIQYVSRACTRKQFDSFIYRPKATKTEKVIKLECGPVHNVMAALCRAVTLPRRETRWNLLGCPKLPNRSQPLVGQLWGHMGNILLFNKFFPIVDACLSCGDTARQSCAMVLRWRFFASCISSGRVQHVSVLHPKFTLRPHHVYGRHPICDGGD